MVPTDGMWIVFLGTKGFVGLILFYLAMILPAARFVMRCPPSLLGDPRAAVCTLVSALLPLYMIDCLLNAFPNMIYVTLAGGLMSIDPNRFSAIVTDPFAGRIILADRYRSLGRSYKQERRSDEAESAWRQALDLLTGVLDAKPNLPEQRLQWLECANDLAWLRANRSDVAHRDPDAAVAMAQLIVEKCPRSDAYWNTLGVAYYRAGDNAKAVYALERARTMGRGTAFDEVFLSYGARTPRQSGKSPPGIRARIAECRTRLPGPSRAQGLLRRSPVHPLGRSPAPIDDAWTRH